MNKTDTRNTAVKFSGEISHKKLKLNPLIRSKRVLGNVTGLYRVFIFH